MKRKLRNLPPELEGKHQNSKIQKLKSVSQKPEIRLYNSKDKNQKPKTLNISEQYENSVWKAEVRIQNKNKGKHEKSEAKNKQLNVKNWKSKIKMQKLEVKWKESKSQNSEIRSQKFQKLKVKNYKPPTGIEKNVEVLCQKLLITNQKSQAEDKAQKCELVNQELESEVRNQ